MNNKSAVINKLLLEAKSVAFFALNPEDTDGIVSALTLSLYLKNQGVTGKIYAGGKPNQTLDFLANYQAIEDFFAPKSELLITVPTTHTAIKGLSYERNKNALEIHISAKKGTLNPASVKATTASSHDMDVIVTCGVSSLQELGGRFDRNAEVFYEKPIINLNHRADAEEFGKVNLIDLSIDSSSEIIYQLLTEWGPELVDKDIASCLLAGILAKTESFQKKMTSPAQFDLAATLIEKGADRLKIITELYKTKPMSKLKLWGKILERLSSRQQDKIIWSTLNSQDYKETGATVADVQDLLKNYLVHSPNTELAGIISHDQADTRGREAVTLYIAAPKKLDALEVSSTIGKSLGNSTIASCRLVEHNSEQAETKFINACELFLRPRYNIETKDGQNFPQKKESKQTKPNQTEQRVAR